MTIDERISSELRRHLPQVDEHGAWDQIQTAATVRRRRRAITLVTMPVAALGLFVGLLVLSDDAPSWEYSTLQDEEISVTPDLIQLGGGLVGPSVTRSENITYVLTGRVQGQQDILFAPEAGLLAAFDDTGAELWRTELDGTPSDVVVVAGDLWVSHGAGTVSLIDSSDGRVLDQVTIGDIGRLVGAFGSVWVETGDPAGLVRVHPSLSTTSVEVPLFRGECDEGDCPHGPMEGAGAIWVPLKNRGVAAIDPDTNQVTVIPVDVIGHEVVSVAVDGDVVYVSSVDQVTSIVDGEVQATVSTGRIRYLGRVEGVFGALETTGRLDVLRATDPMVVEVRETSGLGLSGVVEIDGEAWAATGPYTSRRVELLPVSKGDRG